MKSRKKGKNEKKVLLLANIQGDGLKSMELVKNEYSREYTYTKVLAPKPFLGRRFSRVFLYPFIAFFHRGYDAYHVMDHSYAHLVHFLPKDKTVVNCHDLIPLLYKEKITKSGFLFFKSCLAGVKKAKKVVAISENTKKDIIKHLGVSEEDIEVIPIAIHLKNFKKLANKKALLKKHKFEGKKVIMALGSGFYKNTTATLKTLYELRKKFSNVVLVKVGKFMENEEALIEKLDLRENIKQYQNISEKKLVELYNCADTLLFPSLYEGFGRPPLEAMSCGTPVVSTNLPYLEFMSDTKDVAIVKKNSVKEMVSAVSKIFRMKGDSRKKLSRRLQQTVKKSQKIIEKDFSKKLATLYDDV